MNVELNPKNLLLISAISSKIPDTVFTGRSRNTIFKFRAGFIYVKGRIFKQPLNILTKIEGKRAESLIFPFNESIIEEMLNSYNISYELSIEEHPDLQRMLETQIEKIIV